ncbi:RecQ family ATP-dependent DNA helicase [Novosphingobium sediminicola]|uniref:ATP-dependent DNA helicase RecQ n=1 Tax=Novosphingobium sediminicola TaxID=563162 RepID=A0A7W6G834_9SPHN|nr:ATP-dependent DNA helicase RecQ [Novosphingobium sediminicola]MBB3957013.1 RecQ family ATP-dependent DNA helicase [Novosphingobium sediminicola]
MDELTAALREHFGHDDFRPTQRAIIERVMAGGHTLAVMPTGGGKSLTYQLPALLLPGTAIIISPLIALMQDQMRAAKAHGLRAATLTSADEDQPRTIDLLKRGALDLLYVAPERAARDDFAALLAGIPIALFAVDEAHCVSEWGHDFRPDYRALLPLLNAHPTPRLCLTATADAHTAADITEHFAIPPEGRIIGGYDRPNIHYAVLRRGDTLAQIRKVLADNPGPGIIYARTRAEVEKTADALSGTGRRVLPYHAGMRPEQRRAHQQRFFDSPSAVMVATIAFGMGVDKPDVRFIVHLVPPLSVEAYYQETGRAGRDGRPALALLLWQDKDLKGGLHRAIASDNERGQEARWRAMERLIRTWGCRREVLLRHFGDDPPRICGNCDHCARWPIRWPSRIAQAVGRILTRGR